MCANLIPLVSGEERLIFDSRAVNYLVEFLKVADNQYNISNAVVHYVS